MVFYTCQATQVLSDRLRPLLAVREGGGLTTTHLLVLPKLEKLLGEVRRITQTFTEYKIQDDTAFFLLLLSTILTKSYKKSLVCHLLNAAKACIPLFWKQQAPPTIATCLRKVEEIKKMEDLVLTAQHNREEYS